MQALPKNLYNMYSTYTNPTALNTQSTMEICPATRNPYLKTLDQGIYPNTTVTTPMDKEDAPIKIGEVVWFLQDMTPRGLWPIGRITEN